MAAPEAKVAGSKPSFASVVAKAPPSASTGPTIIGGDRKSQTKQPSKSSVNAVKPPAVHRSPASRGELHNSMAQLDVKDPPVSSKTLNEQTKSNIKRAGIRLDDDQTQISSSSTKPPSLDGKSTTSGTTFAFDEKESLRPDDSASVQAVDDDEIGSGPMSGAPNSRIGSEAGSRAFRDQFNEISASSAAVNPRSHPLSQGISVSVKDNSVGVKNLSNLPQAPPTAISQPDVAVPVRPVLQYEYQQEPDGKIFEALDSPKDRLFLLRLEQEIINFVKNSTEKCFQLPPCNSFCRLLAHKLADYYALSHVVDNAQSAVTLYRTPYCHIPKPISLLVKAQAPEAHASQPAPQPAMKIMRRPDLHKESRVQGSGPATTESSVVPSKAGSETGDDSQQGTGAVSPTESTLAKDKAGLSRAEREARYKEKREELFGIQNENDDSNDAVNELSRASSRNEERKRKKKHRNNNDDFEARSQFSPYYPTMQYAVNPYASGASSPASFGPYAMTGQAPPPSQPNYFPSSVAQQGFQQGFPTTMPTQAVPLMMSPNGNPNSFNHQAPFQGFDAPQLTQFFIMQAPMMMSPQTSTMSSPSMEGGVYFSQPLQQTHEAQSSRNGYSQTYAPQIAQQQQFISQAVPYQFGQLPCQTSMHNGKLAHPLPGSYNRQQQTFNPQTRSFVPNTAAQHTRNSPHVGSPVPLNHRNSSNVVPNGGYFTPAATQQMPSPPQKENLGQQSNGTRKHTAHTNGTNSPMPSTLSKWGTPATLPRKPPPPEAPSMPDSLPVNNQFTPNIQPLTAGQPMPHYQNGVYSMPNTGHR